MENRGDTSFEVINGMQNGIAGDSSDWAELYWGETLAIARNYIKVLEERP